MFEIFNTHPILQLDFKLGGLLDESLKEFFSGNVRGELSLWPVEVSAKKAVCSVSFFRLSETALWDPGQTIITGGGGIAEVNIMEDGALSLDVKVQSFLQLSGVGYAPLSSREEGDYRLPSVLPLSVALKMRLAATEGLLSVWGLEGRVAISLGTGDFGSLPKKEDAVALTYVSARFFALGNAFVDASKTVRRIYFLPIRIIMLQQEGVTPSGASVGDQIQGSRSIWTSECGIEIRPFIVSKPLVATPLVNKKLMDGITIPLEVEAKKQLSGGIGVPVIFVQRVFIPAGARTTGLGRGELVILTDQNPKNKLLLAHELGHILRGTDYPNGATGNSWPGQKGTIMQPSDSVDKEPPPHAGATAMAKAFQEAYHEDIAI